MRTGSRWCLACGLAAALCLLPTQSRAQVTVSFLWHQPDMQTFYVNDFVGLAQESFDTSLHPDLFTVILTNTSGVSQDISIKVTLRIENLSVEGLVLSGSDMVWAQSKVFTLEPQGLQINNRELSKEGRPYSLDDSKSGYDEDTAEALQDIILQSGLLPSGSYIFYVEVFDQYDQLIPGANFTHVIVVSNPTRVDLIGPGASFGEDIPVIATDTPQFFWSTDAIATGVNARFLIRVVKVEEGETSADAAMQSFAEWEKIVENQTTEIYPSSPAEAIALEGGATYAWQVTRLVEASHGTEEIKSDVFLFMREDPSAGAVGAGIEDAVSQMVNQIMELQGVTSELQGYQPTGQVLIDGRLVDLNSLRTLLEQVLSGQLQIGTIIIR